MANLDTPRLLALATLLTVGTAAPAQAQDSALREIDHLRGDGDFIDDPFALSADGSRLAWITTDGATKAQLHFASVGDHKSEKTFNYGSITPERVQFLDADRVIVVERNPETQVVHAEVFGPTGGHGKFGPVTDIGLGTVGGVPAIVTWHKTTTPNRGTTHTFSAYRRDNLKPLAKRVLSENPDGRIPFAASLYKPLYFLNGFATLVGQKEGGYDKAHDIRRPDVAARADVFASKLLQEKEIKDVVSFAEFTNVRKKHINETNFVRFSDDRTALELIDDSDTVTALTLPRPLAKYDPETLAYRPDDSGNLTISLTVDPVNAEAVKAQKADKDWLDIYHVDVKSKAVTEVVRIDGEKRPTGWYRSGSRLALLRKHKGFGRGGADLFLYELPVPPVPKVEPKAASTSAVEPKAAGGTVGGAEGSTTAAAKAK
jgi:hypothetical protein